MSCVKGDSREKVSVPGYLGLGENAAPLSRRAIVKHPLLNDKRMIRETYGEFHCATLK